MSKFRYLFVGLVAVVLGACGEPSTKEDNSKDEKTKTEKTEKTEQDKKAISQLYINVSEAVEINCFKDDFNKYRDRIVKRTEVCSESDLRALHKFAFCYRENCKTVGLSELRKTCGEFYDGVVTTLSKPCRDLILSQRSS
ncbi:MAG TPA: hypothetical protein VEL47_06115 [Myxococcota bacterium]|nr:hypothetical protein [Myxococcota bacterium]